MCKVKNSPRVANGIVLWCVRSLGSAIMAAKGDVEEIENVQVDGLVALKIVKHCQEEGSSSDVVTGFLVGLVVGKTLEITNCFALPKDFDSPSEESQYQVEVLRKLRAINMDYHQVGWYQSTYLGSHVTREFLESHVQYQQAITESVVLVYDPLRTAQGKLSLKAFRLTPKILGMLNSSDPFSPESVQRAAIGHSDVFKELPVVLRNSRLVNTLLCELEMKNSPPVNTDFLEISSSALLHKNMQLLMDSVDSLQQDTYRLLGYEKNLAKQTMQKQQFLQKRREENQRRAAKGEPPLLMTEDVIEQELNLKPVNPPPRLDALLIGEQVDVQCKQMSVVAGETFAKLYLAEALQPK